MNRYILPGVVLCVLIVLLGACSNEKKTASSGSEDLAITGKIVALEGEVTLEGIPAEEGSVVKDGQVIQTAPDGFCEIQFMGSNIIRVFEDSIIRLSFKEADLRLDRGAAAAVLRNIASLVKAADKTFSVRSGSVVAGVRGTSFFVKQEDSTTTYFCLCNGRIDMGDKEGRYAQPMESSHHNALWLSESDNKTEVRKAPMLYHTDEQMEALAARIGQTIDWDKVEGYGQSY